MSLNTKQLLSDICALAKTVGEHILSYAQKSNEALSVRYKANETPLTLADEAANALVVERLRLLTPDYPVISEEEPIPPLSERMLWKTYWLIDPLDGTRGFLDLRAEFTVNIALIHEGRSIMGVVYAPAEGLLYYAAEGLGAYRAAGNASATQLQPPDTLSGGVKKVILGRYTANAAWKRHLEAVLPGSEFIRLNSSLKLCRLAEGEADLYPRAGNISEWDVAAADCLLREAGGAMVDCSGRPLRYNGSESVLCPPFAAVANKSYLSSIDLGRLLSPPN